MSKALDAGNNSLEVTKNVLYEISADARLRCSRVDVFVLTVRTTALLYLVCHNHSSERFIRQAHALLGAVHLTRSFLAYHAALLARFGFKKCLSFSSTRSSWFIAMALVVFHTTRGILNAFALTFFKECWLVCCAVGAIIFVRCPITREPTTYSCGVLLARFASWMAPQIAFGASETRFTLGAMAILLRSGSFVTSTDAVRATISHASWAVETNLASLRALSFLVTLIVLAILWARLANPLAGTARSHFVKERKATRDTRFWLTSHAMASFWTSSFWASLIAHVTTPARFATIFALAILLVASTIFAPAGACLVTLLSKESVLTIAFAKPICFITLIVFAALRAFVFASFSPEFEVLTSETFAILFSTAWNFRFLDFEQGNGNRLRAIAWTWLVAPQPVIVNFALLWASSCREERLAIWGANQIVIEHAVWTVLWALLVTLSAVVT